MVALRRFTQSPRYRALWHRDISFVAAYGAGFVVLLSSGTVHDLIRENAESWVYPLVLGLIASATFFLIRWFSISVSSWGHSSESHKRFRVVEDRLDELERLKRRAMVSPEEYAAIRLEILNDL